MMYVNYFCFYRISLKTCQQQQRETKLADIHTAAASRAGSRANSLEYGSGNGAIDPGTATGAKGAQGPTAPGDSTGPSATAA